jgi:hypothetical protein
LNSFFFFFFLWGELEMCLKFDTKLPPPKKKVTYVVASVPMSVPRSYRRSARRTSARAVARACSSGSSRSSSSDLKSGVKKKKTKYQTYNAVSKPNDDNKHHAHVHLNLATATHQHGETTRRTRSSGTRRDKKKRQATKVKTNKKKNLAVPFLARGLALERPGAAARLDRGVPVVRRVRSVPRLDTRGALLLQQPARRNPGRRPLGITRSTVKKQKTKKKR